MVDRISLTGKSFEDLLGLFMCDVGNDDDFYDVIAYNIEINYRGRLSAFIDDLFAKRLRAVICGTGMAMAKNINYFAYLVHEDEFVVSASIDALRRSDRVNDWLVIQPLSAHKSPFVRGATLRYAKSRLGGASVSMLLDALNDGSEIVRENALDELDGIATPALREVVRKFLDDPSENVRAAAQSLLDSLT